MCLLLRRCHRPFSIRPVPILCLNRVTSPSRPQHQAQHLQHQAPFQVVRLHRLRMKSPRVQPLDLSERPSQKRARSIITEAASRDPRWGLIIAAIHLVFVSIRRRFIATQLQPLLLWHRPPSTGRRPCGGPAIMIMHPVNGGVDVPGMGGMGGVPGITGTEDGPAADWVARVSFQSGSARRTALGALRIG